MGAVIAAVLFVLGIIAFIKAVNSSEKLRILEKDYKSTRDENIRLGRQVNDLASRVEDLKIKCKRAFFDCPDATDDDWTDFSKRNKIYE